MEMTPITRQKAAEQCKQWHVEGKCIVFTNGCFDLLHRGHVENLTASKSMGDKLVVGLNSDHSVSKIKGPNRPLVAENDRAIILQSLQSVDLVVLFDEELPTELIKALRPDILVKGNEYTIDEIAGAKEVLSWGGSVKQIPVRKGYSTSSLIERIINTSK